VSMCRRSRCVLVCTAGRRGRRKKTAVAACPRFLATATPAMRRANVRQARPSPNGCVAHRLLPGAATCSSRAGRTCRSARSLSRRCCAHGSLQRRARRIGKGRRLLSPGRHVPGTTTKGWVNDGVCAKAGPRVASANPPVECLMRVGGHCEWDGAIRGSGRVAWRPTRPRPEPSPQAMTIESHIALLVMPRQQTERLPWSDVLETA